jgi:integrase/recombinase XerD
VTTVTTLEAPCSATVLPDEASAVIEVFVAGFQSAKTRSNYRANLRGWFRWTDAGGIDGLDAQRGSLEAYIRHLEAAGYAPNTICQRIATLASFYRWAVGEGQVAGNPVEGARRPRKPTESTANGLSRHELTDWLDAAERRGGDGYACACLLALNGLRVGELCACSVEDLGESTWHHTLTLRASTTTGCEPAVIALAPRTVQAIDVSVAERRSGPLLSNSRGRRMTPYNVAYLVTALCREIGVDRRITPHSLRHSAITIALDAGIGLRDVQDFARHEDPKTTRRYDRARNQLNRHATYPIAQYLAGGS